MSNTTPTNKGHVLLGLILGLMVAVFAALIAFMLMTKNNDSPINETALQEEDRTSTTVFSDPNKSLHTKVPLSFDDKKSTFRSDPIETENSDTKLKSSEDTMQDIINNGLASSSTSSKPKKKKKELPEYVDEFGEKRIGTPTANAISVNNRDPEENKPKPKVVEANPNLEIDPIASVLNQDNDNKSSHPKETKVVKTKAEKDGVFYVQVGSFKNSEQADKQKAVLLMQGMQSQVSEAEKEGSVTHRVRMGPFYSKKEIDDVTKKLNHDGMLYKVIKTDE